MRAGTQLCLTGRGVRGVLIEFGAPVWPPHAQLQMLYSTWRPSLLGWRPSLLYNEVEAIALRMEAITLRKEAIPIRLIHVGYIHTY